MFYRRLWRTFLWWPLFLGFVWIKRLANVEALLLLRTRPVRAAWWRAAERPTPSPDVRWPVLRPRYLAGAGTVYGVRRSQLDRDEGGKTVDPYVVKERLDRERAYQNITGQHLH
jgi:hypothetical protein